MYKNSVENLGKKGEAAQFYVYCAKDTHGEYSLCYKLEQKLDSVGKMVSFKPREIAINKKFPFKVTNYVTQGENLDFLLMMENQVTSDQIIPRKAKAVGKNLYPQAMKMGKKSCGCKGKK